MFLLAQAIRGWGIGQMAIAAVVIAAVCALVFVAFRQMGIAIPAWVQQCAWIVVVALVVIFCIRLVLTM